MRPLHFSLTVRYSRGSVLPKRFFSKAGSNVVDGAAHLMELLVAPRDLRAEVAKHMRATGPDSVRHLEYWARFVRLEPTSLRGQGHQVPQGGGGQGGRPALLYIMHLIGVPIAQARIGVAPRQQRQRVEVVVAVRSTSRCSRMGSTGVSRGHGHGSNEDVPSLRVTAAPAVGAKSRTRFVLFRVVSFVAWSEVVIG